MEKSRKTERRVLHGQGWKILQAGAGIVWVPAVADLTPEWGSACVADAL